MAHVETGNIHLGSSILHHTEALEINSLEKAVRNTHTGRGLIETHATSLSIKTVKTKRRRMRRT